MECPVVRIKAITPIPDTALVKLTLEREMGHDLTLVAGDHYEAGQLGFFIGEGAVLPEKLLREMWLWNDETGKGRLAGKQGARVKGRDIGGVWSGGLFYGAYYFDKGQRVESPSWNPAWQFGQDVTKEVGITFK